jgi:alpha-amylase/alpha-mannosidase (GH57 family)
MTVDVLGVAPFAAISAGAAWIGQLWLYRDKRQQASEETHAKVEMHKDGLTFELLQVARQEMSSTRVEIDDLRDEVKKLRAMEQHYYHFQQSLDHLESLLFAKDENDRKVAEGNARAFLNRMQRLNNAKGTIANETQRNIAKVGGIEKDIDAAERKMTDGE